MPVAKTKAPAYNVQTAVDAEHALIVAHAVTLDAGDNRQLEPMAQAARQALEADGFRVVADAGYCNGEQAEACESQGMVPHVPVQRAVNNHGGGALFDRTAFHYDSASDTFRCPAEQTLRRKQLSRKDRAIYYAGQPQVCGACPMKSQCTTGAQRLLTRHLHDEALQRMQQRTTAENMRLRRSTVEHPSAALSTTSSDTPACCCAERVGHRLKSVMAYNLKRMVNVLGAVKLTRQLNLA